MKDWFSITPREKIERWENVLRVLKGLTPHQREHHWDMESWGYNTHCGTVACAAGHCGLDPWFRRRGFKLNVNHPLMTSHAATDFFGSPGYYGIFVNVHTLRTVPQVIAAVKRHIRDLRYEYRI
jgi:hypothetical protein